MLAWAEAYRVLRPGGLLILNLKDHIRRGQVQPVTDRHTSAAQELGFWFLDQIVTSHPGQRDGANARLRVPHETVSVLRRS
jgi:DNA modification methylase